MNHVILLPVWQLVAIVAATAIASAIPSAYFAARRGAMIAIRTCAAHHDCEMVRAKERKGWTEQLKRQHEELLRENPEALARRRAAEDVERDGHKE